MAYSFYNDRLDIRDRKSINFLTEREKLRKNQEDGRAILEKWSETLGEVRRLEEEVESRLANLAVLKVKLGEIAAKYQELLSGDLQR